MGTQPTAYVRFSTTVPASLVKQVDALVAAGEYPSRSAAIADALELALRRHMDRLIETEAAKLAAGSEQQEAEEDMEDYAQIVGPEGTF
jgi:Arc/MetJ-type ribon-helix-helix transcriptional regulator